MAALAEAVGHDLHYAFGGALIALIGWAIVAGSDAGKCWLQSGIDGYCWEVWHTIYPGLLLPMVVPSTIAAVVFWLILTRGRLRRRDEAA